MAGCGFTPDQIDAMPMHDVLALLRYWRDTPTTHEILKAVYQVAPVPQPSATDPSNIGDLIARYPSGAIKNH